MLVITKFTIQAELDAATVISGLNLQTSIKHYHTIVYTTKAQHRGRIYFILFILGIFQLAIR
jgi:hypothetical protein